MESFELCKRLKALRTERNLKQLDVAKAIHVVPAAISNYETGKNQPLYPVLIELADFYNVSTDYLLGRTKIRTSPKMLEQKLKTTGEPLDIDSIFSLTEEQKAYLSDTIRLLKNQEK